MKKIISISLFFSILLTLFPINIALAAHNPYELIKGDSYDEDKLISDTAKQVFERKNGMTGGTWAGDAIIFKDVDFSVAPVKVEVKTAVPKNIKGVIELRIGSIDGKVLARIEAIPSDWYQPISNYVDVNFDITGKNDIYVVWVENTCHFYGMKFLKPVEGVEIAKPFGNDWFSDISDNQFNREINLLYGLGFSKAYDDKSFKPQLPITRGEFAEIIYKISNIKGLVNQQIYKDVEETNTFFSAINTLNQLKLMIGKGDAKFDPNGFISCTDAVCVLVKLLGYGKIADLKGGYPTGYINIAYEEGLLNGLQIKDSALKRDAAIKLIYNSLYADFLDITEIQGEYQKFKKKTGILSKTMSIYTTSGVISENGNTSLFETDSTLKADEVLLNDEIFKISQSGASKLLGKKCDVFYQDVDNVKSIIAIHLSKSVNEVSLIDEYINSISNSDILYDNDKVNSKEKRYKIDAKTAVIYNGKLLDNVEFEKILTLHNKVPVNGVLKNVAQVPLQFKGNINWVDNNGDNIADVLFVNSYVNYVLGGYDSVLERFADKLGKLDINLSNSKNINLSIISDNKAIESALIKSGMVAQVYRSVNTIGEINTKIIVTSVELSSMISQIEDDKVTIDSKEYRISDEYTTAYKNGIKGLRNIAAGVVGIARINANNEIVWFEDGKKEDQTSKVGLFLSYNESNAVDRDISIKIFNQKNKFEVLKLKDKLILDGMTLKSTIEILKGENGLENINTNTPIRYKQNSDGEIIMLDTYKRVSSNGEDLLGLLTPTTQGQTLMYHNSGIFSYESETKDGGNRFGVSDDAILIKTALDNVSTLEKDFSIGNVAGNIPVGLSDKIYALYSFDYKSNVADIAVSIGFIGSVLETDLFMFEKASDAVNEFGEQTKIIYGYLRGVKKNYVVDSNYKDLINPENILPGTILNLCINPKGEVNQVKKMFNGDGSNGGVISKELPTNHYSSYTYHRYIYSKVVEFDRDFLVVSKRENDGKDYLEYLNIKGTNIVICDIQPNGSIKVSEGNENSILQGDKLVIYMNVAKADNIIVYRGVGWE